MRNPPVGVVRFGRKWVVWFQPSIDTGQVSTVMLGCSTINSASKSEAAVLSRTCVDAQPVSAVASVAMVLDATLPSELTLAMKLLASSAASSFSDASCFASVFRSFMAL